MLQSWLLTSCGPQAVLEETQEVGPEGWGQKRVPTFTIQLEAGKRYPIDLLVRYNKDYPFSNVYINLWVYGPDSIEVYNKYRMGLLFDPVTGTAKGRAVSDQHDLSIALFKFFTPSKSGKYTFRMKQYMRQDPLVGITSVGMRVGQAQP